MKKAFPFIWCTFALFTSKASISDVFTIDKIEIASEIKDLTNLETYLYSHPNLSYNDLLTVNPSLVANTLLANNSSLLDLSFLKDRYPDDTYRLIYEVCSCCISVGMGVMFYYINTSK